MDNLILDPNIPYVGSIGGGGRFTPQKLVRIQGRVPSISQKFDINLQCGPCTSPQDDVALQISVRLLDGLICLNSLQRGIWDKELRKSVVPIKRTERFEIVILCEFSKYKVAINGQHYCEFPQRIHYDKISHLSIQGDVSIIEISYESAGGLSTAGPSVPMPVAPMADESDDFEILDNATAPLTGYPPPSSQFQPKLPSGFPPPSSGFQPPSSGFQPPPSGFQPPSSGFQPPSSGFQPPRSGFYPPPNNSYPPNNHNINFADPPTYEETLGGPPYPTGPTTMHPQPMQPTYVSGLQPPPGTMMPLNAVGSNFRPVKRDNTVKHCFTCIGIVIVIIIVIVMVALTKIRKNRSVDVYSSSSSNTPYFYNDNNNYDSYNNNNNYYDSFDKNWHKS